MADIEKIVRGIVALADINVITKRQVRQEYQKVMGIDTLSVIDKKAINAALDKIVHEIAQKTQPGSDFVLTDTDNTAQKEAKTHAGNVIMEAEVGQRTSPRRASRQLFSKSVYNVNNEADEKISPATKFRHGKVKLKSEELNSFVLTHPVSDRREVKIRQHCNNSLQSKRQLMTSKEALLCVLDSEDESHSGSECFESPQKKRERDKLLTDAKINYSEHGNIDGRSVEHNYPDYGNVEHCHFASNKAATTKHKIPNLNFSKTHTDYNGHSLKLKNPRLISERSVNKFYMELYSKSGIASRLEEGCRKSSSLDFLELNSQKSRQDCGVDSSSDNNEICITNKQPLRTPDRHVGKHGILQWKKTTGYVVESGTESESDGGTVSSLNVAKWQQKQRTFDSLRKLKGTRVLLSKGKIVDSLFVSDTDVADDSEADVIDADLDGSLLGRDEMSRHHDVASPGSDVVLRTPTGSSTPREPASDDSFTTFCRAGGRRRVNSRARKRIFDDSDSDFQYSGSPIKVTLGTPKRNGKHTNVVIKTVDMDSTDVDVIESRLVSDSEMLESIENKAERVSSSRNGRKEKSRLKKKGFQSNKQIFKQHNSLHFITNNSGSDISIDNVIYSQKNKHSQSVASIASKSAKSSVFDLSDDDDDDEYNVPLNLLKSCSNFSSWKVGSKSNHRGETKKCSVIISTREREISNNAQCNSRKGSDSVSPKIPVYLFNSIGSNMLKDSSIIPLIKSRESTAYRQNANSDSSYDSVSSPANHLSDDNGVENIDYNDVVDDNDEHIDISSSCECPCSDSEGNSSSLTHISPECSPHRAVVHSVTEKVCHSTELSRLRAICRTVGLVLRNTKELAGCSTDMEKIVRIQQLLREKGMQGKPTLKKAEKLNLWKEMKDLKSDMVKSNKQTHGRRPRKVTEDFFRNTNNSPRKLQGMICTNTQSVFSDLKDVITINDSDS